MLPCHDPVMRRRPLAALPIAFAVLLALAACTTFSSDGAAEPDAATRADGPSGEAGAVDSSLPDSEVDGGVDAAPDLSPGCADGTVEAFDLGDTIAACAGGWTLPGLGRAPNCVKPGGSSGCAAADLCASGWHLCTGKADVASSNRGSCEVAFATSPGTLGFFATAQRATNGMCGADNGAGTGNDDLYGCGTAGLATTTCGTLDRTSGNQCSALSSEWYCPAVSVGERDVVTKGALGGGVLCCKNGLR